MKNSLKIIFVLFVCSIVEHTYANDDRDYYFVTFADKQGSSLLQFSDSALAFRARHSIPFDSLDYVVSPLYVDSVRRMGAEVLYCSRWMNGVEVRMTASQAALIAQNSFVKKVEMNRRQNQPWMAARRKMIDAMTPVPQRTDGEIAGMRQLRTYNLLPLHNEGYRGQGVTLAVIDAGFLNADTMRCFEHLRQDGRFRGVYDFSTNGVDPFRDKQGEHGSNCLSIIAGLAGDYQGSAPDIEAYVISSEENMSESPKEMMNLVAAFEKCDSLGVWIISVSLGYAEFDNSEWTLTYSQLDGRTTCCSRAAVIAARKGILICGSAGNEGNDPWRTISVPMDADSILTVGAVGVDSVMGYFSSFGPSADGRIKPEVCAVGVATQYFHSRSDAPSSGNGTSYAAPLVAGLAACLWSALPLESNMQIRERIIHSSHLYPDWDLNNQMGYGIPNAWKAYLGETTDGKSIQSDILPATKIMMNGQIVVVRDGEVFDMMGRKMKE